MKNMHSSHSKLFIKMADINFIEIQPIQISEQGLKQHGLIVKLAALYVIG